MQDQQGLSQPRETYDAEDLEQAVQDIVARSNLKASRQPVMVRRAMANYLEPEESAGKPWETWL